MPKTHYCWRCRMQIPMLTNEEWEEVRSLLQSDLRRVRGYMSESGLGLQEALATLPNGACQRYAEITGFAETNPNAIWHHHLSNYGPECPGCGHLFRTSAAAFCANCGFRAGSVDPSPG